MAMRFSRRVVDTQLLIVIVAVIVTPILSLPSTNETISNPTVATATANSTTTTTIAPAIPEATAAPATTQSPATTSTSTPPTSTTSKTPTVIISEIVKIINIPNEDVKDVEEAKKIINEHIDATRTESRIIVNKPTLAPQMTDFAPESVEAKVSEATTQFGLNFIKSLPDDKKNVILSPLSLQNLLNMILLGANDNSETQQELAKVLNYDSVNLLPGTINTAADRLKPHEAMHSVFQSILAATHLSLQPLLNTDPASLPNSKLEPKTNVAAHLQTSVREGSDPLTGQVNFTLANLVLTNRDLITLKEDYKGDLKKYYNVKVEQFSNAKKGNKSNELPLYERVNGWVKKMTQNQIEKLASESDLGPDLTMVLLNAAHFKGRWLHTFNPMASFDNIFHNFGSDKDTSEVKFMRQKAVFGYADFTNNQPSEAGYPFSDSETRIENTETLLTEDTSTEKPPVPCATCNASTTTATPPNIEVSKEEARKMELISKLNCTVLMLPFSLNDGQELSMVILLPAKRNGISELQAALDGPTLNEIYRSLSEQHVQVELPKFSFEGSHDAKSMLLQMGLKSIFGDTAKLDRMYNMAASNLTGSAKVDKVIHKAKVTVDETGAEAAAASMATVVLRNFIELRPPAPTFIADHPFLFIIRHNRSNMPLFMGRVDKL